MSGSLPPSPLLRFSLLPLSLLHLFLSTVTSSSSPAPSPTSCPPPVNCGEVFIQYPFWVVDGPSSSPAHPSYCGFTGFNITCQGGKAPMLSLSNDTYAVTSIDYNNQTISLADADVLFDPSSCPRVSHSFTLEYSPLLEYTQTDTNLTFCFDCSEGPSESLIPCLESFGGGNNYVFVADDGVPAGYDPAKVCAEVFVAPVLHEVVLTLMEVATITMGFGGVLKHGFQLGWNPSGPDGCSGCESSGGRCGYNATGGSSWVFVCYCGDGLYDHYCGEGRFFSPPPSSPTCSFQAAMFDALSSSSMFLLLLGVVGGSSP